ncbi:hypothetical protein VNO78_10609 [Psophocarpus tetragonolobus]|uniref:Uncharacterized protein n=1 Tax=Psophocarpus tetragonolobus TaxID=3891 RepID=A0AAN9XN52_PSOTE
MYYKKEALNDKLFPLQNGGSAVSRISCHILRYGSCSLNLLGHGAIFICNTVKLWIFLFLRCVFVFYYLTLWNHWIGFNAWLALQTC